MMIYVRNHALLRLLGFKPHSPDTPAVVGRMNAVMSSTAIRRPGTKLLASYPTGGPPELKRWGDRVLVAHPDHPLSSVEPDGTLKPIVHTCVDPTQCKPNT